MIGDIGQAESTWRSLALDQSLPCITAFSDDILGVLLVLAFTAEGELVLWLSVWDLVNSEPFVGGSKETGEVSLNVLYVVELGSERIVDVNDNDLPVSLFFIEKSHNTEDLDLLDLASISNKFTDLADIEWIVITLGLGFGMNDVGVFPGLSCVSRTFSCLCIASYSWEGTVIPEVTLVWEAVADKSKLAFLDILLDGVEELFLGDLDLISVCSASLQLLAYLLLSIRPSWDLDDHV